MLLTLIMLLILALKILRSTINEIIPVLLHHLVNMTLKVVVLQYFQVEFELLNQVNVLLPVVKGTLKLELGKRLLSLQHLTSMLTNEILDVQMVAVIYRCNGCQMFLP